jgi:hypothetical protein
VDSVIYYISSCGLQALGAVHLAHSDRAPHLAREAVGMWLEPAHPAREITVLVASELVTNAVKYADASSRSSGGGDGDAEGGQDAITLRLCQGRDYLRLTVTDPGSSCTEPSSIPLQVPSLHAERGRGLAIVEALSRNRWGSYRLPFAGLRLVWCHLDLNPTPSQLEDLFRAPMWPARPPYERVAGQSGVTLMASSVERNRTSALSERRAEREVIAASGSLLSVEIRSREHVNSGRDSICLFRTSRQRTPCPTWLNASRT